MTDEQKLLAITNILVRISRGTHDPTPTRMFPPLENKEAWAIDSWWQNYYTSNDKSLKMLAKEALNILYGKTNDSN